MIQCSLTKSVLSSDPWSRHYPWIPQSLVFILVCSDFKRFTVFCSDSWTNKQNIPNTKHDQSSLFDQCIWQTKRRMSTRSTKRLSTTCSFLGEWMICLSVEIFLLPWILSSVTYIMIIIFMFFLNLCTLIFILSSL